METSSDALSTDGEYAVYSSSFQCQWPRAARQQSSQLFHAKGPGASLMGLLSETRLDALRFESEIFFANLYGAEDLRPAAAVLALAVALYFEFHFSLQPCTQQKIVFLLQLS